MAASCYIQILLDPCPLTGRRCEVACRLLEALASAMVRTGDAIGPDFGLTGTVETQACGRPCRLPWTGSDHAIEVTLPGAAPGHSPALRAERLRGWRA